jgi:hypothetical protein
MSTTVSSADLIRLLLILVIYALALGVMLEIDFYHVFSMSLSTLLK